METPKLEQESKPSNLESLETLNERIEALEGVVEEFSKEIGPALREYENTSQVVYSEKDGYDDDLKRKNLTALVAKLASFESHVRAIFDLFDKKDGGSGLNDLFFAVRNVQERLAAAPDVRYDRKAQMEIYGAEKNVPANKILDTFEHTQDSILTLKAEIEGINIALKFMRPTKSHL